MPVSVPGLTWSVSLRARQDSDIERDVAAVVDAIGQALGEHFPDAGGYETVWYRLSGPIEGATVRVNRGRFRAAVSVQRFARAHAAPPSSGRALEVRLVATAEVAPPAGSMRAEAPERAPERAGDEATHSWGAACCAVVCALGTAAFGAAALGAAGLLTAWAQALLLLPTLVVWRATLLLARAPSRSIAALPVAPGRGEPRPQLRPQPRDPTVRDAVARWRRLLVHLESHRQLLDDQSSRAPFRVPPRSLGATG